MCRYITPKIFWTVTSKYDLPLTAGVISALQASLCFRLCVKAAVEYGTRERLVQQIELKSSQNEDPELSAVVHCLVSSFVK